MRDLASPFWIKLKGLFFLLIGCTASILLLIELASLRGTVLLLVAIWAFCRAYYFAFYVIEHYIDSQFKFSGLFVAVSYLLRKEHKP